jgi:flagellar biosynthesis protein FlhB
MSEKPDKESKTEPATEKKIRDSVEKGQLPFAKEVPVLGSFFGIIIFAIFFAQSSAFELGRFLAMFLERPDEWSLANANDAVLLYRQVFIEIGKVLGTLMALMVGIGVAASVLQNVPRMVLDRVQPKLSRVSPKEGWSRLFGGKGLAEFVKSIGKLVVAAIILALAMREAQTQLLAGMITQPEAFMLVIREIAIQIILAITVMMIVVAAIDLMWSRYHWHQDLRMTRQEVKDEIKQTDGDPIVKARLRSLQRDRARLRYVREENAAPIVVAKGQDLLALRIREIAEANGIPVFEEVALARSMYGQVSVDSMIPPQFYQAVAELVRVIYQNKGKQPEGPAR